MSAIQRWRRTSNRPFSLKKNPTRNTNSQCRCKSFEFIVQFWRASTNLPQQHLTQHLPISWQSSGGTWVFSIQKSNPKAHLPTNTITRRHCWEVLRAAERTKNNQEDKSYKQGQLQLKRLHKPPSEAPTLVLLADPQHRQMLWEPTDSGYSP